MMYLTRHPHALRHNRRRGSVFILVLALLATLVILALSFTYTARLDYMAARNWANSVQAREAAASGLPLFDASGDAQGGIVSPKALPFAQQTVTASDAAVTSQAEPLLKAIALRLPADALRGTQGGSAISTGAGTAGAVASPKSGFASNASASPASLEAASAAAASSKAVAAVQAESVRVSAQMADQQLYDPAALLNINALVPIRLAALQSGTAGYTQNGGGKATAPVPPFLSEDVLAALIQTVAARNHLTVADPQFIAHNIALHRFGTDALPGHGGADDEETLRDSKIQQARANGNILLASALAARGDSATKDKLDNNFNGQTDETGDGIDDFREALTDPRLRPNGDDQPYGSLNELLGVQGMTPQLYDALAPLLTVFSTSYAAFALPTDAAEASNAKTGEMGWPRVDPNTASAEMIYKTLRARFPQSPTALLAQFTVNMIDRRDADSVPTTMLVDGNTYTGIELTPYINEVCPDVSSADDQGDNGQFLELYNPYGKPISLAGWTLQGAGTVVSFSTQLPANGYLVVTDDFNDANDPNATGATINNGSFYSVFHVAAGGPQHQLIEVQGFDLNNDNGTVKLVNPQGQVVDEFAWANGKWTGQLTSFQRIDPRLRYSERKGATPLSANSGADDQSLNKGALTTPGNTTTQATQQTTQQVLQIQQDWQNKPFRSGLDVMLVSDAYVQQGIASSLSSSSSGSSLSSGSSSATAATKGSTNANHAYAMPVLQSASSSDLDARLIDCFEVGVVPPVTNSDSIDALAVQQDLSLSQKASRAQTGAETALQEAKTQTIHTPQCAEQQGAFNLNTAPLGMLAALPGMQPQMLAGIAQTRAGYLAAAAAANNRNAAPTVNLYATEAWQAGDPLAAPTWANRSDFLLDENIWQGRPLYDRLDAAYQFLPLLATHSQSLGVGTSNRIPDTHIERRPARMRAQRLMAFDRGALETLSFSYAGLSVHGIGDPDLRTASPNTKAVFNEAQLMLQASGQVQKQLASSTTAEKSAPGATATDAANALNAGSIVTPIPKSPTITQGAWSRPAH